MLSLVFRALMFFFAALGFLATALTVAVIVAVVLVLLPRGGFEGCRLGPGPDPPRALPEPTLADTFTARWAEFRALLERGSTASVTYTNAEATARAGSYLAERTNRVRDIMLCFEPDRVVAQAEVRGILGRDIRVVAEGTVDFSGTHPEVRLHRASTGVVSYPAGVRRLLEDLVNRELRDLHLDHEYSAVFDYDRVTVTARSSVPFFREIG